VARRASIAGYLLIVCSFSIWREAGNERKRQALVSWAVLSLSPVRQPEALAVAARRVSSALLVHEAGSMSGQEVLTEGLHEAR